MCTLVLLAFGTVSHVQQSVSSVRKIAKCTLKEFEKVSKALNYLIPRPVWKTGLETRLGPFVFFASLPAVLLSCTHWSCHGLHRVVATFWLAVFAFIFAPVSQLFLLHSHYSFLPFWHCNNETTSAATALGMINLRKCKQHFVNRMF